MSKDDDFEQLISGLSEILADPEDGLDPRAEFPLPYAIDAAGGMSVTGSVNDVLRR